MKQVLTIDLEGWYEVLEATEQKRSRLKRQYGDRVEQSLEPLLNLLDRTETTATFFVVGELAERHPGWIRTLAREGHEIGIHGFHHQSMEALDRSALTHQIRTTRQLLTSLSGQRTDLFRAPGWSLTETSRWALKVMHQEGIKRDSSLLPHRLAAWFPGRTDNWPVRLEVNGGLLEEYPPTPLSDTLSMIPLASGWSFRMIPESWIRQVLQNKNRRPQPVMINLHSWAFDTAQPRIRWPFPSGTSHYLRLNSVSGKLERLLKQFPFGPLGNPNPESGS